MMELFEDLPFHYSQQLKYTIKKDFRQVSFAFFTQIFCKKFIIPHGK